MFRSSSFLRLHLSKRLGFALSDLEEEQPFIISIPAVA